jgi:hypothetical protein
MLAGAVALSSWAVPALGKTPGTDKGGEKSEKDAAKKKDVVILKSGKTVEGFVLEENDREIKMRVVVAGIEATTTYAKSDILEIKRGQGPAVGKDVKAATATGTPLTKKGDADKDADEAKAEDDATADETKSTLYVVELEGRFAFDISKSPLAEVFEEADKYFKDGVPGSGEMSGKTVVDPSKRERNIVVLKMNTESQPGFGSVFQSEEIGPVVEDQIVQRGRRVVFWVEQATGGSAFMPFISPEIYFTSEGMLGGIADLDTFSSGDKMVDEKLIGAFMGHAEGFAIKGGYQDHIPALRAMLRAHYWLAVKFEGGKPVYLQQEPTESDGPGWTILSDDADGKNKDEETALEGNDIFTLEPDWASKLGISDGIADTTDDLAFRLGIEHNYTVVEGKKNGGQKAIDAWKSGLEEALRQARPPQGESDERPGRLWVKLSELNLGGAQDDAERRRIRGQRMSTLREIRAIFTRYGEVLDPSRQSIARLDTMIAQEQLEAERENRARRGN